MVAACAAYNCYERSKKKGNVSFHSFPRDGILREKWIKAIRRKDYNPSVYAKLCSKHFTLDCFEICPWGRLKRLKEGSVPTIFNFVPDPKEKSRKPPRDKPTSISGSNEHNSERLHDIPDENSCVETLEVTALNRNDCTTQASSQCDTPLKFVTTTSAACDGIKSELCIEDYYSKETPSPVKVENSNDSTMQASILQPVCAEESILKTSDMKKFNTEDFSSKDSTSPTEAKNINDSKMHVGDEHDTSVEPVHVVQSLLKIPAKNHRKRKINDKDFSSEDSALHTRSTNPTIIQYDKPVQPVRTGKSILKHRTKRGQQRNVNNEAFSVEDSNLPTRAENSNDSKTYANLQHDKPLQPVHAGETSLKTPARRGKRRRFNYEDLSSDDSNTPTGAENSSDSKTSERNPHQKPLQTILDGESVLKTCTVRGGYKRKVYNEDLSSDNSDTRATNDIDPKPHSCSRCEKPVEWDPVEESVESIESVSSTPPVRVCSKRESYVGDFNPEDLPERAAKCLQIAKDKLQKKNKQIKHLLQRERRLLKKVKNLEAEVAYLQENCRITDDALTILLLESERSSKELVAEENNAPLHRTTFPSPTSSTSTSRSTSPCMSSRTPTDTITRLERCAEIEEAKENFYTEPTSIPWDSLRLEEEKGLELPSCSKVFHLAHTLQVQSQLAKGHNVNEIKATLALLSHWPHLPEEVQKYAFNRLQILYKAMKKGWSEAFLGEEPPQECPASSSSSNSCSLKGNR